MSDLKPVFLRQRNVKVYTVLAHNAQRTRYYVQGVDYTITSISGRVLVNRVRTGRIAEDEVVYFDYEYATPTQTEIDSYRTDVLLDYRFDFGLTPYYYYEGRCQDVDADRDVWAFRDNMHRHRLGTRFEKDHWGITGELELFDDTVLPYSAWHLTSHWLVLREPKHTLDLAGELSRYCFEEEYADRRVWWLDLDLRDRLILARGLSFSSGLGYRWEDDSVAGTTNAVDVECGMQYTRGYLSVELTAEYDVLNITRNEDSGMGIYLNVKRNLTHLLPKEWKQ
jgi:hypothetical protein